MLTLRPLSDAQTRLLYSHQMRRDFPESELKPLASILRMKAAGVYDVLGAHEGGTMVAYALVYHPRQGRVLLLDYLAVEPERRGRGVGTALMGALKAYYEKMADVLLIECERPKAAPDERQARKRIRFYEGSGARLTSARVWLFEVEYSIMALPCAEAALPEGADWAQSILSLYRQMLEPEAYARNVRLIRA